MKKVKMYFEVIVDYDIVIDDDSLNVFYHNDISELCNELYEENGYWWDAEMRFIKAEIIEDGDEKTT